MGIFLGFETHWTVTTLAKQHTGMSSLSSQYSNFAIDSRELTTNCWLSHFQVPGQPDAKTTEAFILQLQEEYHQQYSIILFAQLSNTYFIYKITLS